MNALVTGGAGFIGSHLVEALVKQGSSVTVLDDLSSGSKRNINSLIRHREVEFIKGDCRDSEKVRQAAEATNVIFHFAASPEIRLELSSTKECYERNINATFTLLEHFRKSKAETIVFASSSTVYGDALQIPTTEDYGPLKPISVYGASKLACEAMILSYCSSFRKRGVILRFANIIGSRSTHGVVFDFFHRLKADPSQLQAVGDGKQTKSYLHIDDCVDAILKAYEPSEDRTAIFNVGSDDMINVKKIAQITIKELGLHGVKLQFSGGVDGGRGWIGDVKTMLLDTRRIKALGWKPKLNSKEAVQELVRELKKTDD